MECTSLREERGKLLEELRYLSLLLLLHGMDQEEDNTLETSFSTPTEFLSLTGKQGNENR